MKALRFIAALVSCFGSLVVFSSCGGGSGNGGSGGGGGNQKNSGFIYRGIIHTSWSQGEFANASGTASQDALAASGASWAGIAFLWYMPTFNSNSISPTSGTPTDSDVIAAITEFHSKGLKVMLKPIVYPEDGTWQGAIDPTDVNAWFTSFNNFILHYAALAENNHVEMLCLGTEYKLMSGSANLAAWTNTIAQVRNVYSGKLAYAANAAAVGDEYTSVSFWNQVDVIGLDGYFSLTSQNDPTVAQLVAAWTMNWRGENIVGAIQNFASAYPNQQVIFTEIGYQSKTGTNTNPWDWGTAGPVDDPEQGNCYEAMYEVWSQRTAIKGNFWWNWPVQPPVLATDTDYNPRNKSAEIVFQTWK